MTTREVLRGCGMARLWFIEKWRSLVDAATGVKPATAPVTKHSPSGHVPANVAD
jgi:hypothetical protein